MDHLLGNILSIDGFQVACKNVNVVESGGSSDGRVDPIPGDVIGLTIHDDEWAIDLRPLIRVHRVGKRERKALDDRFVVDLQKLRVQQDVSQSKHFLSQGLDDKLVVRVKSRLRIQYRFASRFAN